MMQGIGKPDVLSASIRSSFLETRPHLGPVQVAVRYPDHPIRMKYLPAIVGVLLGLIFIASGAVVLFQLVPMPSPPPADTPAGHFMAAFAPTGYLNFVKALEILGGILVAIPKTRNLGLLVLGPILVNILAFHAFVMKGEGLASPPILILSAMALYLLWCGRREFGGLVTRKRLESGSETSTT
jgi:uncharacterized membrane protein YphA (DoxX/SURF4 family)